MNTLIIDLLNLIDNHLTVVEDNFLNNQSNNKTKNLKTAVCVGDWKSVLYYLQYYEYQDCTIREAYYGACQLGNMKLIDLFASMLETKPIYGLKYLAKYKHYALIDKSIISTQTQDFMIIEGLICGNDLEMLKSKQLVDLDKYHLHNLNNILHQYLYELFELLFKYNNPEMINYVRSKPLFSINNEKVERAINIGKLRAGQLLSYEQLRTSFYNNILYFNEVDYLTRNGQYQIVEKLIDELHPSSNARKAEYVQSLINNNRMDLVEAYVSKHRKNKIMLLVALRTDNVELFQKHYSPSDSLTIDRMLKILLERSAYKICSYLFDNNKIEVVPIVKPFKNPKLARLLVQRAPKIELSNNLVERCIASGFDVVADILSKN